nr:MAG TPA: hypothetical protein [Caudoviricetes sp.]
MFTLLWVHSIMTRVDFLLKEKLCSCRMES